MIKYLTNLDNISEENIGGFFERWKKPLSEKQHIEILKNISYFILAFDNSIKKVVGFINALSDLLYSKYDEVFLD